MLKKVLATISLVVISILYLSSNSLFFLEDVKVVKGEKSKGNITVERNYPFYEKAGIYKSFDKNFNYKNLLDSLDCKFICEESLDDVKSIYFYSKSLSKFEIIKGEKVNLQIAISKDEIVIGTPIIYGGY